MPQTTLAITLSQQIEEQRREVFMTKGFYARLIREGRMTEGEALKHLARKMAVLETLEALTLVNVTIPEAVKLRTIRAEIPA